MLWISMVVLFLEAVLALVVAVVYGQTRESPNAGGGYALGLLALPFVAAAGAFLGAALSAVFVLPAIQVAAALGRRYGGRNAWWWVPLVLAAAFAPLAMGAALLGAADWTTAGGSWMVATVALTVPALVGRSRRGTFGAVAGWGVLAVISVGVLGGVALGTHLLPAYHPPTMSAPTLVGTWSDGKGATLTFTADGRVTASGVQDERLDENLGSEVARCTGEGTWTFEAGRDTWSQEVDVSVQDCQWLPWNVGGTQERPTLYQYIGDPDSWDLYKLRKV
ncbi:hypothetical protein AB0M57_19715 [Streptomyces sp. NPDC051597]|uniref:hypothetical protein n=1 Tax=Streptomyces sp. NPDC051597 TaxID=3155049 RepID=UPI00342B2FF3